MESRKSFGKVFDVFGPVSEPMYMIKMAKDTDFEKVVIGTKLFYAPGSTDHTILVLTQQLQRCVFLCITRQTLEPKTVPLIAWCSASAVHTLCCPYQRLMRESDGMLPVC